MSDDDIRAFLDQVPAVTTWTRTIHALADEALARGVEIVRLKGYVEQDVLRGGRLRGRVAQLETALRDQANWIKSDGSGCWCANTSVCKNDPWCREARAALAATSR